jgi:sucrose-6-phosphate hydrolase SacC (GH32 family)
MNRRSVAAFAIAAFLSLMPRANAQTTVPDKCYLFSSFRDNGQDGLHLAWSPDGYHWTAINGDRTFMRPQVGKEKLVRDPCILQGPDGEFQMVWTDSWTDRTIGYSHSADLIHWAPQRAIPVMESEPTALNCWAPEIDYDAGRKQYVIFWSTTIPGRFPATDATGDKGGLNHRVYAVTSADLQNFSQPKLFFDPGYDCIDATMLTAQGKHYLIFKNETLHPLAKFLCMASSDDIQGPYANVTSSFTRTWVEGPTAIKIGDYFIVYYDCYRDHHYGAVRSKDMVHWEDITSLVSFPSGMRHGTVLEVSGDVVRKILNSEF